MSRVYWELMPTKVVETTRGRIRGLHDGAITRFLGIPYAKPPIGALRWRPPEEYAEWRLIRDAFDWGPIPAQNNKCFPGFAYSSNNEDCLYLNVFTPGKLEGGETLPVMVWIPGGGLITGASNHYDPSALIANGRVVIVSINYRLNVFGFFSHPEINSENHSIANYGIMDQQFALRWVRDNISGFGGDPDNVTLFGESAGGHSVWCHLVSPKSSGLFHRAIIQSSRASANSQLRSARDCEAVGVALAEAAKSPAASADALRSIPATDLLAANAVEEGTLGLGLGKFHIGPTVDGEIIPDSFVKLFSSGRFNKVPVINGCNRDEYRWHHAMSEISSGHVLQPSEYAAYLASEILKIPDIAGPTASEMVGEVLERYPLASFTSPGEAFATAMTDGGHFANGNRRANRLLKRYVEQVYAYEFNDPHSPVAWPKASFPYASSHTQEMQYLFPGFAGSCSVPSQFTAEQDRLSLQMIRFWTNFARYGQPSPAGSGLPEWHPVDPVKDNYMLLEIPESKEMDGLGARHHCDFWDKLHRSGSVDN